MTIADLAESGNVTGGADIDVPILIVGGGPTGMTLGNLLARSGQKCLIIERRDGTQPNPSAHVVNGRTLEIFRQAGFNMDAINAIAKNPSDAGYVNFVTTLNGHLIGRLPFERQGEECLAYTPTPLRNISQHILEPLLARQIADLSEVELRYGTEWLSSTQDDDGVTSVIRDVATGEETTVRSSYLLAADGAGSEVRKSLDIEMIGPRTLQDFVAIHFRANLRPHVAGHLGVLYFVMDPAASGALVAHDLDHESVFMVSFDPAVQSIDDFGNERCVEILRDAIGDDAVLIEVVRVGTWHMTAQVAERMRDQRTFLVGDSAHRFPPTGGMGLNTGVGDAHNLAWKLCAVEDGWASTTLLDSYDIERRPIAETNCEQSTTNAFKMVTLFEALDLHPGTTSSDLATTIADPDNAERIAAGVEAQATHFNMLGLQLGYVYADGALVRDGEPPAPITDPTVFDPTGEVGARLPHAWLVDGRSTLDLIATDALTLLTRGADEPWRSAVAHAQVAVHHVPLIDGLLLDDAWFDQCRLAPGGALLIRPDQHIGWRTDSPPTNADDAIAEALHRILA